MKVVLCNIGCGLTNNLVSRANFGSKDQLERLKALDADVYLLPEMVGTIFNQYVCELGPFFAVQHMRTFRDTPTWQGVAIISRHPIDHGFGSVLGYLHEGGVEGTAHLIGRVRECQAAVVGAIVMVPGFSEGVFCLATHGAWTRACHTGLQPHQEQALETLNKLLEQSGADSDEPIFLGGDFNALLGDVAPYMPTSWLGLTDDEIALFEGTSLDLDNPTTMEVVRGNRVIIDGIFHSPALRHTGMRVVRDLSDHVGIVVEVLPA